MNSVYLDSCATTQVDSRVAAVVQTFLLDEYGNAGSRTHSWGAKAAKTIEEARQQISGPVSSNPEEVIFTSGATESNNIALLGIAKHAQEVNKLHVITTAVEHKAVLEPADYLKNIGFDVTVLPVDEKGWPNPKDLDKALRPDTVLVSTMHVNNETGVELPLNDYSDVLANHEAWWHVDAAQSYGKINEALIDPRIDLISISGHKVFAPKGIGALIVRRRGYDRPPLTPLVYGGGQERGLRPGTLPVALIAGLGLAAELADTEADTRKKICSEYKNRVLNALSPLAIKINGDEERVVSHVLNVSVPGLDAEAALVATKDLIAVSNGSACTSSSYEPSHVLTSMGLDDGRVSEALRISWDHETSDPDWELVVKRLSSIRR